MLTSPTFRRSLFAGGSLATLLLLAGCDDLTKIDPVSDPNNASIESVLTNASLTQLSALAVGTEASLRLGHLGNSSNNQVLGTLGREVTVLAQTESRWYFELQGRASPTTSLNQLDDAAFYNGQYLNFARVGRTARVFRASAENSAAIDDAQKAGVGGFTRTYEALSKLHLLMLQGENGIRVELNGVALADLQQPGPFVLRDPALINIRQQLDEANTNLAAAGAEFSFPLSPGYAGFDAPATFSQVNRALAARVALYQKDYAGALTALNSSFYSRTAELGLGPKMVFNATAASDAGNPYFQVPDGSPSALVAVPNNFVTEAEAGDLRLSKAPIRTTPLTVGGFSGVYEARVFPSQNSPLDIIRNEELILIAAEARANTGDLTGALEDINAIRTRAGGLPVLKAADLPDLEAYTNEILRQRRYSLFYEGHRLVDLRRLGRLQAQVAPNQTLPYTTTPFKLFPNLQRPAAEKAWDAANPTP